MPVCASPIKAEVARFTLLDACGAPVLGDGSAQVTTDSFVDIQNSPNYEAGQRFLQRKANGTPCVNEQDPGFLNWIEQTVNLCTLDVDLIGVVTGEDMISSDTDFIGVQFGDGLLNARFSKEVWQPVSGQGACNEDGLQQWIYWAFPHEYDAQIQSFAFANDVFTFGYMSKTKPANPAWDIGDPWLGNTPVSAWGPNKHFAFAITTTPPPEPSCGAVEIGS